MRLVVAIAVIVTSELAIRALGHGLMPACAPDLQRPISELPLTIGPWTGEDIPLDPHINQVLGAHAMLNRMYRNQLGDQVAMNIGVWLEYEPVFPHRPELCYSNAGWEVSDRTTVTVSPRDLPAFDARILLLEKQGQRIAVMYWSKYGPNVALDDDGVRRALQKQRGIAKERPPGIKVLMQTDLRDAALAQRTLLDFVEQLLPQLNQIIQ